MIAKRRSICAILAIVMLACACRAHRVPVILARSHEDDGAAALAMVLAFHNKKATLDELRALVSPAPRRTATGFSVVAAARHYGLKARGVLLEKRDQIALVNTPAILHWSAEESAFPRKITTDRPIQGTFVVLERKRWRSFDIIDPYAGRMSLSADEFFRHLTGIVLLFDE